MMVGVPDLVTTHEPLVGRAPELAEITRAIDAARAGHGSALRIVGEPGVGKSRLLAEASSSVGGFTVLSATCSRGERDLPFGTLADLLRPIVHLSRRIPVPQRAALLGAMALGPPSDDHLATCVGALSLLEGVSTVRPLLVLVDDLHDIDRASGQTLEFCCRRLAGTRVLMLAAMRPGGGPPPCGSAAVMEIGSLADAAARSLLDAAPGGAELLPHVARRLLHAAAGNPLALGELPGLLSPGQRDGAEPLADPIPPGPRVLKAFRDRVEDLPTDVRAALLVVAVATDPSTTAVLAALRHLGLGAAELEHAEDAGVLSIAPETVAFCHPLLRGVVTALAGGRARRRAHAALAAALDPVRDAEEWAWHRAEAAIGPDDDVALALSVSGRHAATRGEFGAAATAFARAARLSGRSDARAERLVAAAESALAAAHTTWACDLVRSAWAAGPEAALRTRADLIMGQAMVTSGELEQVTDFLVAAASVAADAESSALMLALASFACTMRDDSAAALAVAQRGMAAARAAGTPTARVVASAALILASVPMGRARDVAPHVGRLLGDLAAPSADPLMMIAAGAGALGLSWAEMDTAAREIVTDAIGSLRGEGNDGALVFPLGHAAQIAWRRGEWAEALALADEAVGLASEAGQSVAAGFALANRAIVHASAGRSASCARDAERARQVSRRTGAEAVDAYVAYAEGLAALGDRDPDRACAHLQPLAARRSGLGVGDAVSVPWRSDLIEALVQIGDVARARGLVAALADAAMRSDGPTSRALVARCRALIDPSTAWERHFRESLVRHAQGRVPFEAARTRLLYGERLRRERRRAEARDELQAALGAFEALGARSWAARARAELDASGMRARRRVGPLADYLTPRELQVAHAVAEGATNREVAARFFLSQKTVERHLGSVYRKLGLRSRSQLARSFATGEGEHVASSPPVV